MYFCMYCSTCSKQLLFLKPKQKQRPFGGHKMVVPYEGYASQLLLCWAVPKLWAVWIPIIIPVMIDVRRQIGLFNSMLWFWESWFHFIEFLGSKFWWCLDWKVPVKKTHTSLTVIMNESIIHTFRTNFIERDLIEWRGCKRERGSSFRFCGRRASQHHLWHCINW